MIKSLKTDVEGVLKGIANIGLVEDEGRTESLPFPDPLWNVRYENGTVAIMSGSDDQPADQVFSIRGYMPCAFGMKTSAKWDGLLDLIIDAFKAQKRFAGIALIQELATKENNYVMYGAAKGAILCHFVHINISIRYID